MACEYGYEFAAHDCRPILGIDTSACEALSGYQMSQTHRRLVAGDTCADVSLVIPDTDGRGHGPGAPAGPSPRGHGWTTFFVLLLVRPFLVWPRRVGRKFAVLWVDSVACRAVRSAAVTLLHGGCDHCARPPHELHV